MKQGKGAGVRESRFRHSDPTKLREGNQRSFFRVSSSDDGKMKEGKEQRWIHEGAY